MNRLIKRLGRLFTSRHARPAEMHSADPVSAFPAQVTMPMAMVERDNLTVPTQAVSAGDGPNLDDTHPSRPIVAASTGGKLSSDETNPRRPRAVTPDLPEPSDAPMPVFGTPDDPYAGLFPPPAPDDDDYLETSFLALGESSAESDDPTPTEGDTPTNYTDTFTDLDADRHLPRPQPPDSLPL